ncbi:MAG TPA: FecR domain-containing protein [Candidatus Eisenbacteria bacterium]|nr:FecR domain-containing protein [Candidatus Eisenbacteria bacterium]
MSDRYLWDKGGPPDPEVQKLEQLLSRYGHHERPLSLPEEMPVTTPKTRRRPVSRPMRWLVAAALIAVPVLAGFWLFDTFTWRVAATSGAPQVGERELRGRGRIALGSWIETNAGSSARLEIGRIGFVSIAPNSRLRVLRRQGQVHRLALERGALEAYILAPPRRFVVDTPSATAVDLGCVYELEVDPTGAGSLTVVAGWVSFESHGRESFVPAGARCTTRPGRGPGTPHFTDAPPALKNALFDVDRAEADAPDSALSRVLSSARREDAFTLWHLLVRLAPADRSTVYDRLAVLVPPPRMITREGVIGGDRAMLDAWWDALGLGLTKDWRRWKGADPGQRRS